MGDDNIHLAPVQKNSAARQIMAAISMLVLPNIPFLFLQNFYEFDRAWINLDYIIPALLMYRFRRVAVLIFAGVFLTDFTMAVIGQLRIDIPTAVAALRYGITAGVVRGMSSLLDMAPLVMLAGGVLVWKMWRRIYTASGLAPLLGTMVLVLVLDAATGPNMLLPRGGMYLSVNLAGSSLLRAANELALYNVKLEPTRPTASAVGAAWSEAPASRLLLVVVEAWGAPADPARQPYLLDSLLTPAVQQRYAVRQGSVPFRNSTSGAELRELCGLLGAFVASVRVDGSQCLPARLARHGYRTVAIHGYMGSFYSRSSWYPRLGFQSVAFLPELQQRLGTKRRCGAAFHGLCDRDAAVAVARALRDRPSDRQLVYWLTLSSHVPVTREAGEGSTFDCSRAPGGASMELCNMYRSWDVLFSSLAAILAQPDLPPTDVVIVGDHKPPFVKQEQAAQFSDNLVPWVALTPRKPGR